MKYPISEKELYAYRPKPFLFVNTQDENELKEANVHSCLADLEKCGFGGFILFNKPLTDLTPKHIFPPPGFLWSEALPRRLASLVLKCG